MVVQSRLTRRRLGEGAGRGLGWAGPWALLHTAAAVQELYDELNAWLLDPTRIRHAGTIWRVVRRPPDPPK